MSTSHFVRLSLGCAVATALLLTACSRSVVPPRDVSYAGLDAPLGSSATSPIVVGILADATGPGAATGRPFVDVLRSRFQQASPLGPRPIQVHVFDDRSRPDGVRNAASRFESDPGVALAIVAPGADRALVLAEAAFRTPIVCAGCDATAATREGTFSIQVSDAALAADTAADWILASLRDVEILDGRRIASSLRAHLPRGATVTEGRAPARDPYLFRDPPPSGTRP